MITKTLPDFGLTTEDIGIIADILYNYPSVKEVKIFGSRAKGNYKPGSDVDLCVTSGDGGKDIYKIKADFEESNLPYFVDLINLSTLTHKELADHIKRTGIIFYRRETHNNSPF